MKVHQMLTCIFILSLQNGNTGLINAQTITGVEGGNIRHGCDFLFSGSRKTFCKEGCEEKDILVETTGGRAQRGRYSIGWKEESGLFGVMTVSITNLTKSDSGRYRCRLGRPWFQDSNMDFEIRVEDAPLMLKPTQTLPPPPPPPPSVASASTPTPSASTPTPSAFTPTPSASTPTPSAFTPTPSAFTPTPSASTPTPSAFTPTPSVAGVPLYVRLTLVVIFIVSSAAVLIFCRRRASKAEDPPVEAEYVNVTEANTVYEELREDRQSRSPPVEISTVYNLPCSQFAEDSV